MNLDFSPDDTQFRQQVRSFVEQALPSDVQHKVLNGLVLEKDDYLRWQRALHAQGWGGPAWNQRFGGAGWNAVRQYIFEEECAAAGAPRIVPFGVKMWRRSSWNLVRQRSKNAICQPSYLGRNGGVRVTLNLVLALIWHR